MYLLVELDVSEYGMHPPCLAEHGTEGQREPGHQQPRASRADVGETLDRGQSRVEAKEDDAAVRQHAADDDRVVQVGA